MINAIGAVSYAAGLGASAARVAMDVTGMSKPSIPLPKVPHIKFDSDTIVLWVPGTSNHTIHPEFARTVANMPWIGGAELVLVDYMSTWALATSAPHGRLTLEAVLDYIIKHKKPHQKIVIAGESQGALVIGETLTNPRYMNVVSKAVLMGHPGVSRTHYHDDHPKVVEFNNMLDPATFNWRGDKDDLIEATDKFFRMDLTGIPILLRAIVDNPLYAIWLAVIQAEKLPYIKDIVTGVHTYSDKMEFSAHILFMAAHEEYMNEQST